MTDGSSLPKRRRKSDAPRKANESALEAAVVDGKNQPRVRRCANRPSESPAPAEESIAGPKPRKRRSPVVAPEAPATVVSAPDAEWPQLPVAVAELVDAPPARSKRALPFAAPAGSPIATALTSGALSAEFFVEEHGRDRVSLRLRAANDSAARVRCHVFIPGEHAAGRAQRDLLRLMLEPHAVANVTVAVPREQVRSVVAEFTGRGVSALVSAPDPDLDRPRTTRRAASAVLAAGVLAGLAVFGSSTAAKPTTGDGPPAPGRLIPVAAVVSPHPARIGATGAASAANAPGRDPRDGAGAFIQTAALLSARSTDNGPLAPEPVAQAPAAKAPPASPAPRLIDALRLERPKVAPGQPITVAYAPLRAAEGQIRLLDDRGTVRAEALLGAQGTAIVLAPQVPVAQDFRVVVDAEQGDHTEERELAVRIEPSPRPTASPTKAPPTRAQIRQAIILGKPYVLAQQSVEAGHDLDVTITRHEPAMAVTLLDRDGNRVVSRSVGPRQDRVALNVPRGMFPETYVLDVTYIDDAGEEHAVSSVDIR